MLEHLSWSDTFMRMVKPDTITYTLPPNVKPESAPSELVIDGFGTLELQRTRVSVHQGRALQMVDTTKRAPLHAAVQQPMPAAGGGYLPASTALAPAMGVGSGDQHLDTPLFTAQQMTRFGAWMGLVLVGGLSVASGVAPLLGAVAFCVGTVGMACVKNNSAYHIFDGEVPPPMKLALKQRLLAGVEPDEKPEMLEAEV